jgi:hypothetical protein
MPAPLLLIPLGIKAVCALCGIGGACYCVKKFHDAYKKGQKTKRERLALKGKSIQAMQEDNKRVQVEIDEWKRKYEDQERENKRIEEELDKTIKKANDPSLPEEERKKWKKIVADLEDELRKGKNKSKSILDTIKGLGERIKKNNKTISDSASNPDNRH